MSKLHLAPHDLPHLSQVRAQAAPIIAETQAEFPDGNLEVLNGLRAGGPEPELVYLGGLGNNGAAFDPKPDLERRQPTAPIISQCGDELVAVRGICDLARD